MSRTVYEPVICEFDQPVPLLPPADLLFQKNVIMPSCTLGESVFVVSSLASYKVLTLFLLGNLLGTSHFEYTAKNAMEY
jgi:hypothetical protein